MSDEREKGDGTKTDDPSDKEEEDAENDDNEEVEEGGDGEEAEDEDVEDEEAEDKEVEEEEAEKNDREEDGSTESYNAAKNVTTVRKAVEDIENELDIEKQDDDRNDVGYDEA
jgi:hypothetical protein